MKKNKIKIDKNYNLIKGIHNPYTDDLDEKIDLLQEAKKNGLLDNEEFEYLFSFVVRKELEQNIKIISNSFIRPERKSSFLCLVNYNKIEEQYA